jgi:hypothetical protein
MNDAEKESKSIAKAIFDSSEIDSSSLSTPQHDQAMDYLSIQLSIRDREQLLAVLCNMHPDLVTQSIRDGIAAFDPIIRSLHQAVDLSGTLTDLENFLTDFVKVSKGSSRPVSRSSTDSRNSQANSKTPKQSQPTVEDFVQLLRKHQGSLHRFLHQVAKNGKEVTKMYREYAESAVSQFRIDNAKEEKASTDLNSGAGVMTPHLQKMFSELPDESRQLISDALDAHSAYLMALHSSSRDRMRSVLSEDGTPSGPGIYLAKWQHLMDSTKVSTRSILVWDWWLTGHKDYTSNSRGPGQNRQRPKCESKDWGRRCRHKSTPDSRRYASRSSRQRRCPRSA